MELLIWSITCLHIMQYFFLNLRSHSELTIPQIFMQYHEYLLTFYLQYESESVTYLSNSGLNKLTKFSFLCFFVFCFLNASVFLSGKDNLTVRIVMYSISIQQGPQQYLDFCWVVSFSAFGRWWFPLRSWFVHFYIIIFLCSYLGKLKDKLLRGQAIWMVYILVFPISGY